MTVRKPRVAGSFYPLSPGELNRELDRCLIDARRREALGVVSPHAGYVFSGPVAGEVFSRIEIPGRAILLGPNHTGLGEPYSLSPDEFWRTPLGDVEVDSELGRAISARCPFVRPDRMAHLEEHSIEVQVPFLQRLRPGLRITPIAIAGTDRDRLREIGAALAGEISARPDRFLIVASSDLTHFERQASVEAKDRLALDAIAALDEEALWRTVRDRKISMCGLLPVYVTLVAAKVMGAAGAEVVSYRTSGEVSGDFDSVVGYGGVVIQ